MKITINKEEVLCDKNFTIEEEMLNTSSVILNNVYPKAWEVDKDYVSRFYYPKDYSKCKIFDEIVHPTTREDVEGSNFQINVDTTKQYEIQSITGETTQSSTPTPTSPVPINITTGEQVVRVCGKNLFNKNNIVYGKSWNNTANTSRARGDIINRANQDITISVKNISNLDFVRIVLTNDNFSANNVAHTFTNNDSYTLTPSYQPQLTKYVIEIQKTSISSTDLENVEIQIEYGSQPTTYEAYNGTTKEINLGKNLMSLRDNTNTANGLTGTISGNTITISGTNTKTDANWVLVGTTTTLGNSIFPNFISGEKYTLSVDKNVNRVYFQIYYYKNGTTTQGSLVSLNITNAKSITFTIPTDYTGVAQAFIGIERTATTINETIHIQLEKGSVASSFTPYKTPIELCKISTYQDYIFKNIPENPNYDSTLEEGQWYLHKEIGRVVLNGSENWSQISNTSFSSTINRFRYNLENVYYQSSNISYMLSNYFVGTTLNDRTTEGVARQFDSSGINIFISNSTASSLANFKTWLSTHNVEVYYVLNTPTNTLIEDEELINQLNSIELLEGLNNVSVSSANLPFIMNLMYNYQEGYTEEDILFCGVVENTGNISLNPRYPHYCNLQVLDFKTFLSEGETLDFVIYNKTILEAINQVISTISEYGFVLGNVNILHSDDVIGAYSTKDKTAYDVFNYLADITQSRWTTRMIDENTVAIDFYDPTLMPEGVAIVYTKEWFCNNNIMDMSFSYSSRDYRNKQVMLSGEVYANIETTEVIVADGYQTQFNTINKIGSVSSILLNGSPATIITKEEYDLGYDGDFIYQPGNKYFESTNLVSTGAIITIVYYAIIEGREIILNQEEISRISNMTNRKGVIARYENRNDATTTGELQSIGQSYLKYKGSPEVLLKVDTLNNIWNIGERVSFSAPLTELTTEYMVKKKTINYITTQDNIFYTYELSSNFNSETEINYFDNQRSKMMGNIGSGEYISRNIDIENTANVIFCDLEVNEVELGDNTLQSELQTTLGVE